MAKGGLGPWVGLALLGGLAWWALKGPSPQDRPPLAQPAAQATPVPEAPKARLAIVLDDWGYKKAPVEQLARLPKPLTLAVIPHLAYSRLAAERGAALGHEVIVHCPMAAKGGGHPEPSLLASGQSALQVRAKLEEDFLSVPGAVGLNNHEGSLATEDRALMDAVAAVLKDKNAYFLDSVTSPKSKIPAAAKAAGIPWAARRVFLDNEDDQAAVAVQVAEAIACAQKRGACIAIGHPRPATLAALESALPGLEGQGVRLVKVSELLERP